MDLACAPNTKVVVTMEHTTKDGKPRILQSCTYPLTGSCVVDKIITDLCVFECDKTGRSGLTMTEIAPGVSVDVVRAATDCHFKVSDNLKQTTNVS